MIIVRPEAYRQYMTGRNRFVLVLEEKFANSFRIEPSSRYEECVTVTAEPGRSLTDLLRSDIPVGSNVLVVAEDDRLLATPAVEVGPGRTVASVRAGPGHLALDQLRTILESLEKSDPATARQGAEELAEALRVAGGLVLEDPLTESLAKMTFATPTWSWTDTSAFQPGTAQSAPAGRQRLAADGEGTVVTGQIAVKGWPVVRSRTPDSARCQELFERLSPLSHYPLVLTVEDGAVTDLRAAETGSAKAAEALKQLFAADPGHGRITGLEFGLNTAAPQLPFNSESNAASTGKAKASVHLVLGSLPSTNYQVLLDCATSTLMALGDSTALAGPGTAAPARPRRRMNRVIAAGCGCH